MQKAMFQFCKLGILFHVISDIKGKNTVGTFYEKELKQTNEKEFRVEAIIKVKGEKPYVKWKGYNSSFKNWVDYVNKIIFYRIKIVRRKVELNVFIYATKVDLKNVTSVDISKFAKRADLASFKYYLVR